MAAIESTSKEPRESRATWALVALALLATPAALSADSHEAAVALYYSEGGMQPNGSAPVGHYLTRVLQVFVKENGERVVRAAHWSPIASGSGTSQSSLD